MAQSAAADSRHWSITRHETVNFEFPRVYQRRETLPRVPFAVEENKKKDERKKKIWF